MGWVIALIVGGIAGWLASIFMKTNAQAVGARIMMPESMNFNHALSDPTLNDPAAAANAGVIGGHIYGGGLASYPLALARGKEIWMTEHLELDTTWTAVVGTAKEIHDCMTAGMSAYVWWYIVRFYGPILENGQVSKRGYVMSQYARFVRPGDRRIAGCGGPHGPRRQWRFCWIGRPRWIPRGKPDLCSRNRNGLSQDWSIHFSPATRLLLFHIPATAASGPSGRSIPDRH